MIHVPTLAVFEFFQKSTQQKTSIKKQYQNWVPQTTAQTICRGATSARLLMRWRRSHPCRLQGWRGWAVALWIVSPWRVIIPIYLYIGIWDTMPLKRENHPCLDCNHPNSFFFGIDSSLFQEISNGRVFTESTPKMSDGVIVRMWSLKKKGTTQWIFAFALA